MIEEATSRLLELGSITVILTAGMVLMYRHFTKEVKAKDDIISQKDDLILEQNRQLTELVAKDIEATTKFNTTLEHLIKMMSNGK